MMRNYKRKAGSRKRRYGDYTPSSLECALEALHEGMSVRHAAKEFNIPKSTLHCQLIGHPLSYQSNMKYHF